METPSRTNPPFQPRKSGVPTPSSGLRPPMASPTNTRATSASSTSSAGAQSKDGPRLPLPRASIGPRKSISNLRASTSSVARSTTPEPGSSSRSSSSMAAPVTPLQSRPSMLARSVGPSGPSTINRFAATPTPASRTGGRPSARFDPSSSIGTSSSSSGTAPPVPPLDARFANELQGSSSKPRATTSILSATLTIGDLGAVLEVNAGPQAGFRGTLRYLGQIEGKGDVVYAGIELLDEWSGQGKNDGTVGA